MAAEPTENQKGEKMWLSMERASLISDVANMVFIASLVVGFVAALAIWQMSGIKEGYWEQERRNSNERISANEAETNRAKESASVANERAEEAKTANTALQLELEKEHMARLKLEEFLAPRLLSAKQKELLIGKLKPYSPTPIDIIIFKDGGADIIPLTAGISDSLTAAGWKVTLRTIIGGDTSVVGVLVMTRIGAAATDVLAAKALLETLNGVGVHANPWDPFNSNEKFRFAYSGNPLTPENAAAIRMYIGSKGQ